MNFLISALFFAQNVATTPAERLNEAWWKTRHEQCQALTKQGGVDLAFLGDSITQGWEGRGKPTWDQFYAHRKPANFGFSGDRTEHVLWRLANGELVGLQPKVIVIMIGTNNLGHGVSKAPQTLEGVKAILSVLRREIPKAKILLLDIFPRGRDTNDAGRQSVAEVNAGFQSLHDGKHVFSLNVGSHFLNQDGSMREFLMPDLLHPSAEGYAIWAKAMEPTLVKLLTGA